MKLYVGNLARTVTESDLQLIFEGFGQIVFAKFVEIDDESGKGYAFVQVDDEQQAAIAISALNGTYLKGLRLVVRPLMDRIRDARANPLTGVERRKANHLHLIQSEEYTPS